MYFMKKSTFLVFITLITLMSCNSNSQTKKNDVNNTSAQEPIRVEPINGIERAYFASGCFWCVEAIYESVKGVQEVISGYSGGHTENPTYESSNTGRTGHAESVEVYYDPSVVSFETLVDVYFGSQNPVQMREI